MRSAKRGKGGTIVGLSGNSIWPKIDPSPPPVLDDSPPTPSVRKILGAPLKMDVIFKIYKYTIILEANGHFSPIILL